MLPSLFRFSYRSKFVRNRLRYDYRMLLTLLHLQDSHHHWRQSHAVLSCNHCFDDDCPEHHFQMNDATVDFKILRALLPFQDTLSHKLFLIAYVRISPIVQYCMAEAAWSCAVLHCLRQDALVGLFIHQIRPCHNIMYDTAVAKACSMLRNGLMSAALVTFSKSRFLSMKLFFFKFYECI